MSVSPLTKFVLRRPWLNRLLRPVADKFVDLAGYRKLGLRFDDLINEERADVQLALKRLPPNELNERVFRIRRAFQCSLSHTILPKNEQTTPEQDVAYLSPILEEIRAEQKERDDLESLVIVKKSSSQPSHLTS